MILEPRMSDQPPPSRAQPPPLPPTPAPPATAPPPLPPQPLGYVTPGARVGPRSGQTAQREFDTVTGQNLRLKDNLIQLAAVIVGATAGGIVGHALSPTSYFNDTYLYVVGGIIAGLIVSVVVSGVIIGIIRGRNATRR